MTTTRLVALAVLIVGTGFAVAQARIDLDPGDTSPKHATGAGAATNHGSSIRPFRVDVPQADLDELRRRILATRWPEKETVADSSQGVPLETMRQLARYWATEYDWRQAEAKLNAIPQFVTTIDGLDIHFLHVRSKHPNALPLDRHAWMARLDHRAAEDHRSTRQSHCPWGNSI